MNYLIGFFWFLKTTKVLFFYLYFIQLKEYHLGRVKAHFETEKGRSLVFNKLLVLKIGLVLLYFFSSFLFSVFLLFLYSFETFKKRLKIPVLTLKSFFLFIFLFLIQGSFFLFFSLKEDFLFYLLVFDILAPFIFSSLIFLFEPIFIVIRRIILKRAEKKREKFKDLKVIGITGSYGKTSVKEFLATILSSRFKVLKTPGHQNSEMGISNTILKELNSSHEIFVCEMGAYSKGGIKALTEATKPEVGILTGVNEQHLSLFKNMENLLSAEGGRELLSGIKKGGWMVFNGSNKHAFKLYNKSGIKSFASGIDAWAEEVKEDYGSLSFKACFKDGESFYCTVSLIGRQNIENLLLSFLAARELGMNLLEIEKGCSQIKPEQGGVSFLRNDSDYKIIDATYSANPDSVLALLQYLETFPQKKTIVMPCLIELGGVAKKVHNEIGKKIAEVCDLGIITTSDYFKEIKEGAGIKRNNVLLIENPEKVVQKLEKTRGVILLKGRVNKKIMEDL